MGWTGGSPPLEYLEAAFEAVAHKFTDVVSWIPFENPFAKGQPNKPTLWAAVTSSAEGQLTVIIPDVTEPNRRPFALTVEAPRERSWAIADIKAHTEMR